EAGPSATPSTPTRKTTRTAPTTQSYISNDGKIFVFQLQCRSQNRRSVTGQRQWRFEKSGTFRRRGILLFQLLLSSDM
ncbi:hypothetical protein MTR67_047888, partial [Solanum verrucosum]